MKLVGYKSPGRRATAAKLRAMSAKPEAKNCPAMFAEDKEFMRLFWESKRLEGIPSKRAKFNDVKNRLRARGFYLENLVEKAS